jgi:hypothetical protein
MEDVQLAVTGAEIDESVLAYINSIIPAFRVMVDADAFTDTSLDTAQKIAAVVDADHVILDAVEGEVSDINAIIAKKLINRYYVGASGHFTTIAAAITWLNSNITNNTELLLDGGNHLITDTITVNFAYTLTIRGQSTESSVVVAHTGLTNKPMFIIKSNTYIEKCTMDGTQLESYGTLSTENAFNVDTNSVYFDHQNATILGFYRQVYITGAAELFFFNSICDTPIASGICVDSTGATKIDVEVVTFDSCPIGIDLVQSSDGEFDVMNNLFLNPLGGVCINYTPATYTPHIHSSIMSNKLNNVGSFYAGFDFTRSDGRDANIYVRSNSGKEDKKPHFKVNVINNSSTTTVTSAGTYYKAVFTNGISYTCKFTLGNNKYTYQSVNATDVVVWISGNVQVNGANRNVDVAIRKNGVATQISPVTVRCASANVPYSFGLVAYVEDMTATNYIEIFVTSTTNGDLVILQDLTIFAQGQ